MTCVCVTGGAGLIGRHLVEHLVSLGHEVLVVDDLSNSDFPYDWTDQKRIHFIEHDITSQRAADLMAATDPEIVWHLSAHAYEGLSQFCPVMVSNTAVIGTLNVLRAAINCGTVKRFVNVSSMARYGSGAAWATTYSEGEPELVAYGPPFIEDEHVAHPEDIYGHGKVMAERCVETLCDLHGIEWCHAVPHNCVAEANLKALSDPYRGVLLIWANQLLRGQEMTVFGDGEQRRAPSYVGDVVPALAKMGFVPEANREVINLGGATHYSIQEMSLAMNDAFTKVAGRNPLPIRTEDPRPCEVKNAWCSVEKSQRLLGYEDKTSLDEMCERIVRWAYSVAPNGVEPRYLTSFEIEKKAPAAWTERRM